MIPGRSFYRPVIMYNKCTIFNYLAVVLPQRVIPFFLVINLWTKREGLQSFDEGRAFMLTAKLSTLHNEGGTVTALERSHDKYNNSLS